MQPLIVDHLIDTLANVNITHYFIVTGGAIAPFVDAVGRSSRAKYYCFQHEQAAAMAAEGYYRASGKIAVVLVTSGPGVQNILNGVCGCWYDSIPAIFISGQVNMNESLDSIKSIPRQVGFQECPVEYMFLSITKYSIKIKRSSEVGNIFQSALNLIRNGRRGPVLIDFPVNIQTEKAFEKFTLNYEIFNTTAPSINIDNYIKESKRPIVVLGNGARDSINTVKTWLETSNIPFVTSWAAADLVEHSNPLRIGYIGVYGDRIANFALQNADLVLILGSRMDTRQTGGNLQSCAREAIKIMVDIDKNEIDKLNERGFTINVPIVSSVEQFFNNNKACVKDNGEWINSINNLKKTYVSEPNRKDGDVYSILENIVFPKNCIIIPDCGGNLVWAMQSIKLNHTQKLFSNYGNSSMGYSLPAAIGAAIGTDKEVPIVCICGDGGIQMNIQELHTVSRLNLPITFIIINNLGYGIIRQFQDQYFGSRYTATSSEEVFGCENGLDIVKIATAYGISAQRSYDISISGSKPILYDVLIDPAQKIFPKLEFGNSLEHMYPYISSLNDHMIINKTDPIINVGWISK